MKPSGLKVKAALKSWPPICTSSKTRGTYPSVREVPVERPARTCWTFGLRRGEASGVPLEHSGSWLLEALVLCRGAGGG